MRFIKYTIITLLLAIITDALMVFAYYDVPSTSVYMTLDGNNYQYTSTYFTKSIIGPQKYRNNNSYTVLTDPCTSCKIEAKPYSDGGVTVAAVIVTMGQTKTFDNLVQQTGNYRLRVKRFDFTLIDTIHYGTWTIN